jgi:hypothetical protein
MKKVGAVVRTPDWVIRLPAPMQRVQRVAAGTLKEQR